MKTGHITFGIFTVVIVAAIAYYIGKRRASKVTG